MSDLPIVLLIHTHNRSDCLVESVNSILHFHPTLEGFHKVCLVDDFTTPEKDYSVFDYTTGGHKQVEFIYSDPKEKINGIEYAQQKGFELIHRNNKQLGCWPTLTNGLNKLKILVPPESLVIYFQNDYKLLRSFPFTVTRKLFTEYDVVFCRLYGYYINERVKWNIGTPKPKLTHTIDGEPLYLHKKGKYGPSAHVTTLKYLLKFVPGAKFERQVKRRTLNAKYSDYTYARFINNVVENFGHNTPFGKYGYGGKDNKHKILGNTILKNKK